MTLHTECSILRSIKSSLSFNLFAINIIAFHTSYLHCLHDTLKEVGISDQREPHIPFIMHNIIPLWTISFRVARVSAVATTANISRQCSKIDQRSGSQETALFTRRRPGGRELTQWPNFWICHSIRNPSWRDDIDKSSLKPQITDIGHWEPIASYKVFRCRSLINNGM